MLGVLARELILAFEVGPTVDFVGAAVKLKNEASFLGHDEILLKKRGEARFTYNK